MAGREHHPVRIVGQMEVVEAVVAHCAADVRDPPHHGQVEVARSELAERVRLLELLELQLDSGMSPLEAGHGRGQERVAR